jgi:ribosomal protein S12 methylthiotransferase
MIGKIRGADCVLVDTPEEADVIVVNTCSFIQPATEESIDTVLQMSGYKESGSCEKLIVTGCMVQRFGTALEEELPEVDHFLGTGEYHRIDEVLRNRNGSGPKTHVDVPMYIHDEFAPRVNSWKAHSAWLKISEGCNHRCAFCIIPTLRGKMRSRTIDSLMVEARNLAAKGVRELNLVSQDSTAYGRDLGEGTDLGALLRRLATIEDIDWIRLHYAYPIGLPASLLEAIADEPKVCNYLDMPLQHASGPMLKAMRRGVTRAGQERILERVRAHVPGIAIRTTFIVGFPGETEEDFSELVDFIRVQKFDRVGVFTYFQEDGTDAALLPNQVPDDVKEDRQRVLMEVQADISRAHLDALIGTEVPVLIDGQSEDHEWVITGRLETQAPEVDGQVFLEMPPDDILPGQIRMVRIDRSSDYDLVGTVVA